MNDQFVKAIIYRHINLTRVLPHHTCTHMYNKAPHSIATSSISMLTCGFRGVALLKINDEDMHLYLAEIGHNDKR